MTDLKPCPFCGHKGIVTWDEWESGLGDKRSLFYVQCESCWMRGPYSDVLQLPPQDARDIAVDRWNRLPR